MRLIDADALIKKIVSGGLHSANCGWSDSEIESDVIDQIDSEPTVDNSNAQLLQKLHQLTTDNAALEDVLAAKLAEIASVEEVARWVPVVHGAWVEKTPETEYQYVHPLKYKCSICGFLAHYNGWRHCPDCGARMDAPKGERDE